jgi:hypothetical protein
MAIGLFPTRNCGKSTARPQIFAGILGKSTKKQGIHHSKSWIAVPSFPIWP